MTVRTFLDGRVTLHCGDCMDVLAAMPDNSVGSIVCDPPYHLSSIVKRFGGKDAAPAKSGKSGAFKRASSGFMGKQWDGGDIAFRVETWRACQRVLKPGGYILAFSSSRTFGRMSVAIEDAGFITHPMCLWAFAQGFPKAHKVGHPDWEGWAYGGQTLKPALEPIYMGQKPFSEKNGLLNILRWGVGALNIDGCRVLTDDESFERNGEAIQDERYDEKSSVNIAAKPRRRYRVKRLKPGATLNKTGGNWRPEDSDIWYEGELKQGRHPSQIFHDGSDCVVAMFPQSDGQQAAVGPQNGAKETVNCYGDYGPREFTPPQERQRQRGALFLVEQGRSRRPDRLRPSDREADRSHSGTSAPRDAEGRDGVGLVCWNRNNRRSGMARRDERRPDRTRARVSGGHRQTDGTRGQSDQTICGRKDEEQARRSKFSTAVRDAGGRAMSEQSLTRARVPVRKPTDAGQPRTHSLIESIANVAIGLGVAVATQIAIFPMFGIVIPLSSNLAIAAIFTVVSIVRSYAVRRLFNAFHVRSST